MLLRQLEYLTALSQEGHFSRAAAACHVSQPALSAGIRKLEAELGVQIVRRTQRFDGFTPEGTQVLEWARRILAERAALKTRLDAMQGGLTGRLRIGAIPTALSVSSLLTTPLRERHPGVQFSIESMSSREIAARLNDFEIDVGMTYVDGEPLGRVRTIPLYRERYFFLTPLDGPFGAQDTVTWSEAASAPLALLLPVMQNRRIIDGHFADVGEEVSAVVETDTVSALYAHVTSMRLSSIIPHAWLHVFGVPEGTCLASMPKPRRTFHVGLVLPGRGPESLLTQALVDITTETDMREHLDRLADQHLATANGHTHPEAQ